MAVRGRKWITNIYARNSELSCLNTGFSVLSFSCPGLAALFTKSFGYVNLETFIGNTVYSALIVTAIFMLDLGVGGYVAGRWADQGARQSRVLGLLCILELK